MQNYFVRITVNDPYPKPFETTGKGSTAELAVKRALEKWRKENWKGRPLKEGTIQFKRI